MHDKISKKVVYRWLGLACVQPRENHYTRYRLEDLFCRNGWLMGMDSHRLHRASGLNKEEGVFYTKGGAKCREQWGVYPDVSSAEKRAGTLKEVPLPSFEGMATGICSWDPVEIFKGFTVPKRQIIEALSFPGTAVGFVSQKNPEINPLWVSYGAVDGIELEAIIMPMSAF
jgi:hypothetical protein